MKVLLREDVDNLGFAGEVHKVADGYGRNFLIPRGLAERSTPTALKAAKNWRARAAARREELLAEYSALAERIKAVNMTFVMRAGKNGKLYGSVTTNEVSDKLNEALGTDVDKRKVIGDPLRHLGEHKVLVRLSKEYPAHVKVLIRSEDEVAEEAAAAAAAAAAVAAAEAAAAADAAEAAEAAALAESVVEDVAEIDEADEFEEFEEEAFEA